MLEETQLEHFPSYQFLHSEYTQTQITTLLHEFDSEQNHNGSMCKILFIGPALTRGIEIYTADLIIYFSPPKNLISWIQIKGRVFQMEAGLAEKS